MQRVSRLIAALSLILGFAFFASPIFAGNADAALGSSFQSGRLGGPESAFKSRFGTGTGSLSTGVTFTPASGYGSVVAKFDKDRAVDVVITPVVGTDWTTDEAFTAALDLLPDGVRLVSTPLDSGDGRLVLTCQSSTIAKEFSSADYKRLKHAGAPGECYALESPDSPTTVNAIELSIGRAGGLKTAAPTATATTEAPLPTPTATAIPPTATPDTRTYVADDGCTYMVATGAFVSCPPTPTADVSAPPIDGGGGGTEPPVAPGGGATALCNDGTYSYAAHHQGACSSHGGVNIFYK